MTASRRRVLAALATAGSAGALTGGVSGAFLGDQSGFGSDLTTGVLDLVVEYWLGSESGFDGVVDRTDPDGVVDGPAIDVPLDALTAQQPQGSLLFRFALPQPEDAVNNPANLWLRTGCPPASSLAETVQVRLSYADASGTRGKAITAGSLREVANDLRTGRHLDPNGDPTADTPGCLTDELFVLLEYDVGGYLGTGTTGLPLFVAAVQCRNGDGGTSPFAPADLDSECESQPVCACCWAIGKVELDGAFQAGTTYGFDEGTTDYALHVTDVDGTSGVAFGLVGTDGGPVPSLCAVHVKGGPGDERYARREGTFGTDTAVLSGAADGLVYAPENPNNGKRYGISYVLVSVCQPRTDDGGCPADLVEPAASVGRGGPPGTRHRTDGEDTNGDQHT